VALLVLAADTVAPLSVQWGNNLVAMIVVWCFGAAIIASVGRFHITLTYVLSFVAFSYLRHLITGDPWVAEIAPITGPMYQLFIFFMITDPKTTVNDRRGQYAVAFLVAAVEFALRLLRFIHAPFYALFLVGPTANLIEIARTRRARRRAAGAQAVA
jgi:enediyne biosynthesis protein E5